AAYQRPVAALRQLDVEEGRGGRGRARPDIAACVATAVEHARLWRHGDCIELRQRRTAVDHVHADGERTVAGRGDACESANEEEQRQGLDCAHARTNGTLRPQLLPSRERKTGSAERITRLMAA